MPLSKNPAKRARQMAHIRGRQTRIIPITVIRYNRNGTKITQIIGIKGKFENREDAKRYGKKYSSLRLAHGMSRYPKGVKATVLIYRKDQRKRALHDLNQIAKKSDRTSFGIHPKSSNVMKF